MGLRFAFLFSRAFGAQLAASRPSRWRPGRDAGSLRGDAELASSYKVWQHRANHTAEAPAPAAEPALIAPGGEPEADVAR